MPSRRTATQAPTGTGQGSSEPDVAPKRSRRPPTAGHDDPLSGTQNANLHTPLISSPIAKTPKQKHWKIVHRRCLQGFKDADRERDELLGSIQRLEADNAQATAKIRQLSDTNDQNLGKFQTLEVQISSLKQQLEFAQACCTTGDNLLPILLEVSGNFRSAQSQLDKKIEAEKNKFAFAGLSASDVLWPAHNGQMGSFGTNSLPNYPIPNTLSSTNQQAPVQSNQQPLQAASHYIPQL
ncbi:hypothetical protein PENARI_c161G02790 [Penicillium arizonense]|uniref:Uncharacterized protein n=1 Tax=Penicillium arizonense TaxID=1835702 RepID=A0A1F5L0B1_PENAI|nr:hypothetical protein PENARI_c161G02790 [Penicillium arizonense]OGE46625.1 hypothetical protein PENARI_c161G02790 [Penicillium arizonense]